MNANYFLVLIVWSRFFDLQFVDAGGNYDSHRDMPVICQPPPYWTADGRDVMYDYLGNVTLVALMDLQCSFCRNQISSLERLNDYSKNHSLSSTKVIIIAPANESAAFVEYYREILRPKGIAVFQESKTEPIWRALKGLNNDFFVYDTCGRLNYHVPYPQSFTYYHYTVNTIYSVHKYHKCGPCSGYPPQRRQPEQQAPFDPSSYTPKRIKAYVITIPPGYHPDDFYTTRTPDKRYPDNDYTMPRATTETTTVSDQIVSTRSTDERSTTVKTEHKIRHDKHKKGNRKRNRTTTTRPTMTTTITTAESTTTKPTATTPYSVAEDNFETSEEQTFENGHNGRRTTETPQTFDTSTAQVPSPSEFVTETSGVETEAADRNNSEEVEEDLGANFERNLGMDADRTHTSASATTTKITTATFASPTTTRKPRTPLGLGGRKPNRIHKPPNGSSECSSFSEMSCFDLQEKTRLDPCCYKGVYLTAICSQDICDSRTYHICCFQKFQQARYQCCHNDAMPFDRPDAFSKCCYNIFVEDDPCCPTSVAYSYWSHKTRITDLCLPNIDVAYDGMVLEAVLKDKSNVSLDLGKFKSLSYECPAASKRADFYYWEPEGPPKFENPDDVESSTATDKVIENRFP